MLVGQDLELDMVRILNELLEIKRTVAEGLFRLLARGVEALY